MCRRGYSAFLPQSNDIRLIGDSEMPVGVNDCVLALQLIGDLSMVHLASRAVTAELDKWRKKDGWITTLTIHSSIAELINVTYSSLLRVI